MWGLGTSVASELLDFLNFSLIIAGGFSLQLDIILAASGDKGGCESLCSEIKTSRCLTAAG